jgi:hypothetical protein
MFGFLQKPKEDQTPPETKKQKEKQPPPETIESLRTFTLKGFRGDSVPVNTYIVLYASCLTDYDKGNLKEKIFEWRLYKSPNVSWVDTPDANLVLYVNGSLSHETTVGLSTAQKEKKRLKYWDVIDQKVLIDTKNSNVDIYEVRRDHFTNVQTIFKRYNISEEEITPPERGSGSHETRISGHRSNLRVLLDQLQENNKLP